MEEHYSIWLIIVSAFAALSIPLVWYYYKTTLRKYFNRDEYNRHFASMMEGFTPLYNGVTNLQKTKLFGNLNTIQSHVAELRKEGSIRILEIGAGSGANLQYYPPNCHLTIVEPNKYFEEMLNKNLKKFPGIQLDNYYVADAEDMSEIKDESFDAVVSTTVACSLKNVQRVFSEVRRVLSSDGKFLYLEHVLDDTSLLLYIKQQLLSLPFIWPLWFDGCHLNRNTDQEVEKNGFSRVEQQRFDIETTAFWVLHYIKRHVVGVAYK